MKYVFLVIMIAVFGAVLAGSVQAQNGIPCISTHCPCTNSDQC